jgi:hypothetical protein
MGVVSSPPKTTRKESDILSRRMDLEMRRARRQAIDTLKKNLKEIDYKNMDYRKLVVAVMSWFDVSRRKAQEYIDVATAELESEKAHE